MKLRNLNLYELNYSVTLDNFRKADLASFERGLKRALYDYIRPCVRYFYYDCAVHAYRLLVSGPFYAVQDEIDRLSNLKHYGRILPLLALTEGVPAELPIMDREAINYISRRWGLLYSVHIPSADVDVDI